LKKLRNVIIIVICAVLCLGYYYYLSNRDVGKEDAPTEKEQIISKDLEQSYPSTPREVIKFYNRILLCLYNEENTIEDIEALGAQARMLMDEELLMQNPEDVYLMSLRMEVSDFTEDKKQIISVSLSTSKEVVYEEIDDVEYAYVESSYYIKGKEDSERAGQTYIIRKDKVGRWKILGYYRP